MLKTIVFLNMDHHHIARDRTEELESEEDDDEDIGIVLDKYVPVSRRRFRKYVSVSRKRFRSEDRVHDTFSFSNRVSQYVYSFLLARVFSLYISLVCRVDTVIQMISVSWKLCKSLQVAQLIMYRAINRVQLLPYSHRINSYANTIIISMFQVCSCNTCPFSESLGICINMY